MSNEKNNPDYYLDWERIMGGGMDAAVDPCEIMPVFNPEPDKCECGAHSVGSKKHSDWCKLYGKE